MQARQQRINEFFVILSKPKISILTRPYQFCTATNFEGHAFSSKQKQKIAEKREGGKKEEKENGKTKPSNFEALKKSNKSRSDYGTKKVQFTHGTLDNEIARIKFLALLLNYTVLHSNSLYDQYLLLANNFLQRKSTCFSTSHVDYLFFWSSEEKEQKI